jgi:hypothetical protein
MKTNGKLRLSEGQLRYLSRIAHLMAEGSSGEVVIVLHQGGVRDYTESRKLATVDLPGGSVELAQQLGSM